MAYFPTDDEMAGLASIQPAYNGISATPPSDTPTPTVAPSVTPPAPVQTAFAAMPAPTSYTNAVSASESGGDPNATNPNSSARGTFQFLKGTEADTRARHPELAGVSINDPRFLEAFRTDNRAIMEKALGRPINSVDDLAAHFLGAGGAITFMKAYAADPTASVVGVVSPDALAANQAAFFHPDGSPKTLGEVYQMEAAKVGQIMDAHGLTDGPNGAVPKNNPYAQQQSDVADFIKSQPGMWGKLQSLQDEYKARAAPTWTQKLEDAINAMQQQQAVADANMHASAGGVINHANPDASQFVAALKSGHDMNVAERARDAEFAKTNYEMGASTLQAKNAQALSNLGLTGSLANQIAGYGIEQRKLAQGDTGLGIQQQVANTGQFNADTEKQKVANELTINLLRLGAEQSSALGALVEKNVPNPETRVKVLAEVTALAKPNTSPAEMQALVAGVIARHQAAGEQISAADPSHMMNVSWTESDSNGNPVTRHESLNMDKPADQARQKELQTKPGYALSNPSATQVSVGGPTVNTGSAGAVTASASPDEQYAGIQRTHQTIAAARLVLAEIERRGGGTGPLTDSEQGKALANVVRQFTTVDNTTTLHQVWGKLMNEIDTGEVLPMLKSFGGRTTNMEVQTLLKQTVGPDYSPAAARAFLDHVDNMGTWLSKRLDARVQAEDDAKNSGNNAFSPNRFGINYVKSNPPPSWNLLGVTGPADTKVINGVTYHRDANSSTGWSQ